ncbi:DUF3027 domain-containing protein [Kocuria oceani]|uniref:DUF3027 domain-containing protein n=1 Tax=Kocuria oceani TaxID=988827 RepID=UPI004035C1A9
MTEETVQDAPAEAAPEPPARPARPARRRAPKQDALLIADTATARAGVEQIAEPQQIGPGHRVQVEEDRLVVHLFECTLPGYHGWNWFASLARAPRSRTVTVCEVGLLPGEDALLAPEWVPWSERVSPEEKAQEEQERAEEDAAAAPADRNPGAATEEPAAGGDEPGPGPQDGTAPSPDGDRP